MRKLLYILLSFLLLTAVTGCRHVSDKRLVLADTLMWVNPDSSLAILNAINRDSLTSKEDLAYHAILLTQAQFRCNIPLTSDTLISKAVDYYSDNHNREHYTRALLYKGGAYEDMGKPIEAMKWYKQAEDNADTTDYRNLAQINMRMGMLYYKNYASNNLDLEKNKNALYYYEKLNDKKMIIVSLLNTANNLRFTDSEGANEYYNRAELLAKENDDSINLYSIYINRSVLYLKDSIYKKAKDYSIKAWNIASGFKENCDYYILGRIYARLGVLDSAEFYMKQPIVDENTDYDNVLRYRCMMDIELLKNNYSNYNKFNKIYIYLVDSIEHNNIKYKLLEEEKKFERTMTHNNKLKISLLSNWVNWTAKLICVLLVVFSFFYFRKQQNTKKLIEEIKNEHTSNYNSLKEDIEKLDNGFSRMMKSQINVFQEIMASAYKPNDDSSDYKITHKIKSIDDSNTEFWDGLRNYLNLRYNGIIDKLSSEYPSLTDSDINFIGLMCCDFSDAAIAVCKGYRNSDSVRSRRRKIRDKMKIDGLLDIYLKKMMRKNKIN